jgi:uncharacterized protein involved in cysteine biosynthesis
MKYPKWLKELTCLERILIMGILALVLAHFQSYVGMLVSLGFMGFLTYTCAKKRLR